MAIQPVAWRINADASVSRLDPLTPDYERHLEDWIERDAEIVDGNLLLIARQYETGFGTIVDLLAITESGDLAVLELKREKTLRETVAQALEYAAWASRLSYDEILAIAVKRFGSEETFRAKFLARFGVELPDTLNQAQRILLVAPSISDGTRAVIEYLAETYKVPINAVSFGMFGVGDNRILVREVVIADEEPATPAASKRRSKRTVEQLLQLAEENGVGDIANYLWSLRSHFLAPSRYLNGWGYRLRAEDGRYITVFNIWPTAETKPNAVVVSVAFENLPAIFGRSKAECEAFSERLETTSGPGEAASWDGWRRFTLRNVHDAGKFVTELASFSGLGLIA